MTNLETDKTFTLYTRWVEVKLADGRVVKGKKRVTAVQDGSPKPKIRPEIAEGWIRQCVAVYGLPVVKVAFRYRSR
jgi:hypothetical protein